LVRKRQVIQRGAEEGAELPETKEAEEEMNCPVTGKARYATVERAWAEASRLGFKIARAYRCEFCGAYHLTTGSFYPAKKRRKKKC
jgi:hypothetical protein